MVALSFTTEAFKELISGVVVRLIKIRAVQRAWGVKSLDNVLWHTPQLVRSD